MATPATETPTRPRSRRVRPGHVVLGLLATGLVVLYAPALLFRPLPLEGQAPQDGWTRVSGALHMHTTHSDGSGTPEELVAAARRLGLAFIVIADHNNMRAKAFEGYHDGVLVMVGCELSTRSGHVLGLGLEPPTFRFSGDARDAVDDVLHLGGFPVVTHPFHSGESDWTAWGTPGPWGLELLNGKSQWTAVSFWRWLRALALYPANASYAVASLTREPRATLARWDELLAQRDVVGTVGSDAHGRLRLGKKLGSRTLPFGSYEKQLGLTRTHVLLDESLTGDAAVDARAIVKAIAAGRCYSGVDALADAGQFSFRAEGNGQRVTMGATVAPQPGLSLRSGGRSPKGARFTLLKNGATVADGVGQVALADPASGVYRVQVRLPGWDVPWILSNPIYVMDAEQAQKRAAAAAWPAEPVPPRVKLAIDDFEPGSPFHVEADPKSWADARALDPHAGIDGRSAARLAFRLGAPTAEERFVSCALVDRTARDLSGTSGLTFAIRADGEYRLWVQIRDAATQATDEGTEWWSASVRTSTTWRRVSVPYTRLFSLNAAPGGRLDLDRVRALVFVVDSGAAEPGAKGKIWIDQLGAYE